MLSHLTIQDFAIIDRVDLDLTSGLVTLTGETGAGKSIVIDAVGGLLGNRLGVDVIRAGAPVARIEGIFEVSDNSELTAVLDELGISLDDDSLIVSREINRAGRSIARINGHAVPLAALQKVGHFLVDLHGQGEHLALLRVAEHLRFLDSYAGLVSRREQVSHLVEQIQAVRQERAAIDRDQRERARQMDLLKFQAEEIAAAHLHIGEDEELRQERLLLANAEKLANAADLAHQALSEAEGSSASDRLGQAAALLHEISRIDPSLADDQQALDLLLDQVEELSRRLRQYRERIDFNPGRLEEIEERLNVIQSLKRKYGNTIEEIILFGEKARQQLDDLIHHDERVAVLAEREHELLAELAVSALELSEARQSAAVQLAREVERELADLNMANARFRVDFARPLDPDQGVLLPSGEAVRFSSAGIDQVEFQVATNLGEEYKPLVRVVSGGETARLMLALKNILSRGDTVGTLIFDEIDAGIGGQTAVVVGQKMASLARQRQIICVTHLAQIASFADLHLAVAKSTVGGRTQTTVRALSWDERVEELAAMVGGQAGQSSVREHVRESLQAAAAWKSRDLLVERGVR
ncbi:MAG TPA: DNA repair protein RecN [Chloroflexota bacterium]|nr:DNA repair protein RecN [Chloroflexota bacterium]